MDYYTAQDIMQAYGLNHHTVCRWCRHGLLDAQKRRINDVRKKQWVVSEEEFKRVPDVIRAQDDKLNAVLRQQVAAKRAANISP